MIGSLYLRLFTVDRQNIREKAYFSLGLSIFFTTAVMLEYMSLYIHLYHCRKIQTTFCNGYA